MAAPKRNAMLRPETAKKLRDQIRTTQIIKRLEAFALGETDLQTKDLRPVEMSPAQVSAALGLMRKSLPDLTAATVSGDPDAPPVKYEFTTTYEAAPKK